MAVKLVQSRAFEVVVIDCSAPLLVQPPKVAGSPPRKRRPSLRPEVFVRKLAMLAEEGGSTVVLLTDTSEPRPMPWPVALRLELTRSPGSLLVKVAKDRACRLASARVAWPAL